jgi:hypothetical protein
MLRPVRQTSSLASLFLLLLLGCSGTPPATDAGVMLPDAGMPDAGPVRAIFELPRDPSSDQLFDLPFPSDLRLTPEGTVDISTFPNPRRNSFVEAYVAAFRERQRGFSLNGAIYFRFAHSVDRASLPRTAEQSLLASATVVLVDVDPESPSFGERHPIVVHYQDAATLFWAAHTVALRPVYGIPLGSARRYAAVVTTGVRPAAGGEFERDADFEALLGTGGDEAVTSARAVYGDVFDVLEGAGIARSSILAATVFTTQDATGELMAIRDWMVASYPAPALVGTPALLANRTAVQIVEGQYGPSPIFQEGVVPYIEEGGAMELDASGEPTVHGSFDPHFALTIPKTPMPTAGYPIVLYAHGTSGDRTSFIGDEGSWLAPLGFAVMGIDQIHHGLRNPSGSDPALLFFNFSNPDAGRDNNRQSALDVVQQARLIGELEISGLPDRTEAVRFDPSRIYFMGHSQGGLNGPLYLAIDDRAQAGVLSAASGVITNALVYKTQPAPGIPSVVTALLGLSGATPAEAYETEGFTVEHPIATLVQTWIDVADAVNYAHMIFESPRRYGDGTTFAPKSVLMTEGLMDDFSPPVSIEALAGAMFVPHVQPVHSPIQALAVRGTSAFSVPVTANVAGGLATAGILQFPDEGHFAIYDNDAARMQVLHFFESMATGGLPTISAP